MFHALRQKGALFVEYALILAFVVIVGVTFIGKNGMADSISNIFIAAETLLETASGDNSKIGDESSSYSKLIAGFLDGLTTRDCNKYWYGQYINSEDKGNSKVASINDALKNQGIVLSDKDAWYMDGKSSNNTASLYVYHATGNDKAFNELEDGTAVSVSKYTFTSKEKTASDSDKYDTLDWSVNKDSYETVTMYVKKENDHNAMTSEVK